MSKQIFYEAFLAGAAFMNEECAKACADYDTSLWEQPYVECNEEFAGIVRALVADEEKSG